MNISLAHYMYIGGKKVTKMIEKKLIFNAAQLFRKSQFSRQKKVSESARIVTVAA
jgi:hypothetical protein